MPIMVIALVFKKYKFHYFSSPFLEEMIEYKTTLVPLQELMAIICSTVEVRNFLLLKQRERRTQFLYSGKC